MVSPLVLLAVVPSLLLLFAAWQSYVAAKTGTDINRCSSLGYRSLWLHDVTSGGNEGVAPPPNLDWKSELERMAAIHSDLTQRYPDIMTGVSEPWVRFEGQLRTRGHVDWAATEQMRIAAEHATNTLDAEQHWRNKMVSLLLGGSGLCLVLTVPWGVYITRRLRFSEREAYEHAAELASVSSRFRDLFQGIPAACFSYDAEGRIVDWNRAAERLFCQRTEDVVGRYLWEAISRPERRDASRDLVFKVLSGYSLPDLEWIYTIPGGGQRNVLTNVFPLRDLDGRVIGGISVSIDITERHRSEERVRQLLTESAESAERLRNVTARAQCLLWEAEVMEVPADDTETEPLFDTVRRKKLVWNMRVVGEEDVLRWLPLDRRPGESFDSAWIRSRPPEAHREMVERSAEALRSGRTRYDNEFPCYLVDGSLRWLGEGVRIDPRAEGHWHLVGICTDITERRAAEERMRTLTAELERSNAALQEFAQIASHDLKEPLRKIRTFSDMLQRRAADTLGPDGMGYLERIVSATRRMQALVDGLMEFSRVSRKPREPVVVSLDDTVSGVLMDLETRIADTGALLTVEPLPNVLADDLQMRQLFQNLIGNALKFSRPDHPPAITVQEISTAEDREAGIARMVVADDGIGFDPRYAERIFDVFEQLSTTAGEGTGVGLAICRKIVERHGGTIVAESSPGAGARFIFTLPRAS